MMTVRILLALGLFAVAIAPVGVMADEMEDQQACMQDAQTVCGQFIPDRERVAHCLMANSRKISPACRTALRHFK
jgi:hypothetical protein